MINAPHWTAYLSALLTPTVAVLGAFIGYRQWRLAQNRLKLDLFERRLAIYRAAIDFLLSIAETGTIKTEHLYKFMASTSETKWIINESVANIFKNDFFEKAIDFQRIESELDGVPAGEIRTKAVNDKAAIRKWFISQHDVLDQKFSQYLQLQH